MPSRLVRTAFIHSIFISPLRRFHVKDAYKLYKTNIYQMFSYSDSLVSEKNIYIHVRKNGKARKKGVIKRVIKGTLFYTTCATALL